MDWLLPSDVSVLAFVLAVIITAFGGFVKGAVGFAQPLIMVSGMGIFLEPTTIVAAIILPILLANLLQAARFGRRLAWEAIRDFRLYILIVCGMILVTAQFLVVLPGRVIFLVLGVAVVGLCTVQLVGWRPFIPVQRRRSFSILAGFVAGGLGGLTGTWGPPTVLYLMAIETPKARQMVAQGVIYGLGALALLVGHLHSGLLNAQTAPFSAALVVPSFLGLWLGFRWHDRLDQERFRTITLLVLVLAGLNLLRKGLTG